MTRYSWRALHATTQRLLLSRLVRSVAQGALVVDLALYLHALGWSGHGIGFVLTGGGLAAAGLSMAIGWLSDRGRRRPYLLASEALNLACGLIAFGTHSTPWLAVAIVLGGFGRGANGAAGPFAPAEQAWLAEAVAPERRGWVYSLNTALGFAGMGIGAALATLAGLGPHAGEPQAYRPLFLIVIVGSVLNFAIIWSAAESRKAAVARRERTTEPEPAQRKREWKMLLKLVQLNTLNGLSIGMTGPLITYWLALRFGVGPKEIAPMVALALGLTAVTSFWTGRLTEVLGLVRSVIWTRGIGVVLLAALPLAPGFWSAATIYLLRLAFSGASLGARQAQVISLVGDSRRGQATSLNAASFQVPQSVGPSIAAPLIAAGWFLTPIFAGAILQAAYVAGYGVVFGRWERKQARAAE